MNRKTRNEPMIRCAIYTRKSSADGLEQEFNSLDAQREAGEAFIASQKNEGWVCLPNQYDDRGFSVGNAERPALKRLLADIEDGQIDCVVVYKVDRLSRSLLRSAGRASDGFGNEYNTRQIEQQMKLIICAGQVGARANDNQQTQAGSAIANTF